MSANAGSQTDTRFANLLVENDGGIVRVTMNRPERRNALSLSMMRELIVCLRSLDPANDRAVIIAGAGPVFSSGHDLNEIRNGSAEEYRELFDTCVQLMTSIYEIPQPVIAEVHGLATAAGCQLVATCDLAVASEKAAFATPGVRIGLFCSTPMVALSRAIGRKRALEMLLTGRQVDSATAMDWGLINRVVAADRLEAEATALAREIAEASSFTVKLGKQAFYSQIDLDVDEAYRYTSEVMTLNALAEDAQEGIGAFLEKRKPCWKGR